MLMIESPAVMMGPLRRGKWTVEEERFVKRIIRDFNNGTLEAAPGTTLRNYLSEKLNCDPMRITKKFTGEASIGKRVFHPVESDAAQVEAARKEVAELEAQWRRKLESLAKEQAESATVGKRKKDDDDSSVEKRRRCLGEAEAQRYDAWLATARALVDAPADPNIVVEIDALLDEGHRLRRDLASVTDEKTDDDIHDDEATSLLVDFLRSAQQQLGRGSFTNCNDGGSSSDYFPPVTSTSP